MTTQNNNALKSLTIPLLLAGVLAVLAGLAYFDLTPKSYRATAVMKVIKRGYNEYDPGGVNSLKSPDPYDPELAPAEAQLLRSEVILDKVIKNLQLDVLWNKHNAASNSTTLAETRAQLVSKIQIRPRPNSSIIKITVSSHDRFETAIIANEITKVEKAYHDAFRQATIDEKFTALKKLWDDENKKVEAAQARLNGFSHASSAIKSSSNPHIIGSERYAMLQQKRKELETLLSQKQQQLELFKTMDKKELRLLISSSDPNTNSVFNSAYGKLRTAEKDLTQQRIAHGDDSPEVKRAQLLVDNLNSQLDRITDGILLVRQSDLPGIQAGLNQINAELKTSKTNAVLNEDLSNNSDYQAAVEDLRKVTAQRDALQTQINGKAELASVPVVIKPEFIELAETPTQPYQPDRTIAVALVASGAGIVFLGLIVFLIAKRIKPAVKKD